MIVTGAPRARGLGLDLADLVVVTVDERDPGARVVAIAALRLVEDVRDDLGRAIDDAGSQPLALGDRGPGRGGPLVVGGGQHVDRGARRGRRVVDGADLGQSLAVALLALGQTRSELGLAAGRRLGGRRAQRVMAHHDAVAVTGQHQHVAVVGRGALALGVEGVEVDRRAVGEVLDLALSDALAGRPLDRLHSVIERPARRLHGRQPAQPVRVLLAGRFRRASAGHRLTRPRAR